MSNGNYSAKDIQEVSFKLTDGVSHNSGIEEMVALELGTIHIPDHLFSAVTINYYLILSQILYHTHPVLMFNFELIDLFAAIAQGIGSAKIFSKFLVTTATLLSNSSTVLLTSSVLILIIRHGTREHHSRSICLLRRIFQLDSGRNGSIDLCTLVQ